jgi:hypothetical protein
MVGQGDIAIAARFDFAAGLAAQVSGIAAAVLKQDGLFLLGHESVYPGWYMQHYVGRDLVTTRLDIDPQVDAFAAATVAAESLGCKRSEIQIEGAPWPDLPMPA